MPKPDATASTTTEPPRNEAHILPFDMKSRGPAELKRYVPSPLRYAAGFSGVPRLESFSAICGASPMFVVCLGRGGLTEPAGRESIF